MSTNLVSNQFLRQHANHFESYVNRNLAIRLGVTAATTMTAFSLFGKQTKVALANTTGAASITTGAASIFCRVNRLMLCSIALVSNQFLRQHANHFESYMNRNFAIRLGFAAATIMSAFSLFGKQTKVALANTTGAASIFCRVNRLMLSSITRVTNKIPTVFLNRNFMVMTNLLRFLPASFDVKHFLPKEHSFLDHPFLTAAVSTIIMGTALSVAPSLGWLLTCASIAHDLYNEFLTQMRISRAVRPTLDHILNIDKDDQKYIMNGTVSKDIKNPRKFLNTIDARVNHLVDHMRWSELLNLAEEDTHTSTWTARLTTNQRYEVFIGRLKLVQKFLNQVPAKTKEEQSEVKEMLDFCNRSIELIKEKIAKPSTI